MITLTWQQGFGASALAAGLVTIPFALGNILGSSQSNRLHYRLGRASFTLALCIVALGLAAVLVILAVQGGDTRGWELTAPLLIAGLGSGLFIAPSQAYIVATVAPEDAGAASGVLNTSQRVGAAVGIAAVGAAFFHRLSDLFGAHHPPAYTFPHAAVWGLAVSVGLAVIAVGLTRVLPRRAA